MSANPRKLPRPVEADYESPRQAADYIHLAGPKGETSLGYVNALRVFSVFAVILIHVSSPVVEKLRDIYSMEWWLVNLFISCLRWAVPVFVLISGSLLLDPAKDETIRIFMKKRADRILIPLIFWSAFYALEDKLNNNASTELILWKIFNGVPSLHLWYLYMLLGLYLFTPALRTYVKHSSYGERTYFLLTAFAISAIFALYFHIYSREVNVAFLKFLPFIAYFVCGYHLKKMDLKRISLRPLVLLIIFCMIFEAGATGALLKYGKSEFTWDLLYEHLSPSLIIMSISIFLLFLKLDTLPGITSSATYKILGKLAPYSFGIYLLHMAIIIQLGKITGISAYYHGPIMGIWTTTALTFFISFVIVFIIAKIPYLKKIVI